MTGVPNCPSGGKIVLLTTGHLGSNPRVVKEADALHARGYDVQVIATRMAPFVEERDEAVMRQAPWRVQRIRFDTSWHRGFDRALQIIFRRFPYLGSNAVADALAADFMTRRLFGAARKIPADLYIAHYDGALPAAAAAARLNGGAYAFDAEDFHPGDPPPGPENDLNRAVIRAVEKRYLPGAAYVTAASPGIARAYSDAYGIATPTVVLNTFPRGRAAPAPTPRGTAPGPSLYWVSQTIGPDRGLECAVRAVGRAACRPHLYLRGTPRQGYADRLHEIAAEAGCAERLHLLPPAPPDEMEALAAPYDAGLVGETGATPNRRIALTNKQFTYMLAGLPSIMSDIPAHRDFAVEAEGAVALYGTEDADSLASVLDGLLSNPRRLEATRRAAWTLGQKRFSWEAEAPKLLACVRHALSIHASIK